MRERWVAGLLVGVAGAQCVAQGPNREMTLAVDLTSAPQKIVHARETLAVAPGALTLLYPKWIPGDHGPTGPIADMAGFVIEARTAEGGACTPEGRVKWERDPVEMYAFHVTVPPGCARLEMSLDFLATAAASGFSEGASTSENFAILNWNTVVVAPAEVPPAEVRVKPSIAVPGGWQFGTALPSVNDTTPIDQFCPGTARCPRTIKFNAVPLDRLIDSPVLAGKYFKEIALAPEVAPKHFLDMVADGPEQLAISEAHVAQFSRLVREAGALFGSRHYTEYHFLVTLSDLTAHFGLEHHESSDDRAPAKMFIEDDRFVLGGDLLPHEFTHSWNGKYRRPAGLATGNYESPMIGDMLWAYEGLTQYLGDVLAVRAGIWTEEEYLGRLARSAATLDREPGRTWRDLQDTARMAQVLYDAGGGWDNWRRGTDFYDEGELLWLDVDTTIRQLTNGRRSLNDFARVFYGPAGNSGPTVAPYTFDQLVAALDAVAPNDWTGFLRSRLDSNSPHAPLGGIERGGYALHYTPQQTVWGTMQDAQDGTVDLWFSLGLHLNAGDTVADVLKGGPADKAGFGPGMHLVAVNGRAFTPWLLRTAIHDAAAPNAAPIELIVNNGEYFRTLRLEYHEGERYPTLDRVANTPDRISDILKPLVK